MLLRRHPAMIEVVANHLPQHHHHPLSCDSESRRPHSGGASTEMRKVVAMPKLHLLALLLLAFVALVSASAPKFCKCTCFKNSTILPLGPEHQLRRSEPVDLPSKEAPRSLSTNCSECTKAFCLSQGIDFCKDATEDDVSTLCFQRDSNKDKIIVWVFIFGTTGLLGWAAFKRAVEYRDARALERQNAEYTPMRRR